jgi:hypothetical protein
MTIVSKNEMLIQYVAGFVMKGFLGGWTLLMKSVGLVNTEET